MRITTIVAGGLAATALAAGLAVGPTAPTQAASVSAWNQLSCSSMPKQAKFWIGLPWHWQWGTLDHTGEQQFSLAAGRYRTVYYLSNGHEIGTKSCD